LGVLHDQLAWYVGGPALGLCVVACRWLFNARLGVTGGFSELITTLRAGSASFDWRGWFVIGVALGGTLFLVLAGARAFEGYGWLTATFDGFAGGVAIAAILFVAGVAIGFGTKTAGGCTSGNGLSGTSILSPASLVATATFFLTAIGVAFAIEAVI
jgi:uncharacterized membrane protein YedE/YeeE